VAQLEVRSKLCVRFAAAPLRGRVRWRVLSLKIRAVEGCTALELCGDFDTESAPRIREVLADLVEATAGPIVVDLGAITPIDNDAFGVLVAADHRLRSRADRLRVARPRPEMLQTMHAAGVHWVLEIYETVDEVAHADDRRSLPLGRRVILEAGVQVRCTEHRDQPRVATDDA